MMGSQCASWKRFCLAVLVGGWLFQPACLRRDLEVLIAPEANLVLLTNAVLMNRFWTALIQAFNT